MSDRLRDAFLEGLPERAPTAECADPARIWSASRGELPRSEAQALVDHALECSTCATAWRMARVVLAASSPPVVHRTWGVAHWAAVAAAVLVVLLIPVGVHEWRTPGPAVYREPGSEIVGLVVEGASVPRSGFVLRWEPLGADTRYAVRVLRADLSIVAQGDGLEGPEYAVPAHALADLAPATVLYWRVEAHLADGSHIVSDTFSVRVE